MSFKYHLWSYFIEEKKNTYIFTQYVSLDGKQIQKHRKIGRQQRYQNNEQEQNTG